MFLNHGNDKISFTAEATHSTADDLENFIDNVLLNLDISYETIEPGEALQQAVEFLCDGEALSYTEWTQEQVEDAHAKIKEALGKISFKHINSAIAKLEPHMDIHNNLVECLNDAQSSYWSVEELSERILIKDNILTQSPEWAGTSLWDEISDIQHCIIYYYGAYWPEEELSEILTAFSDGKPEFK